MEWQGQFLGLVQEKGHNTEIKFLEGTITNLNPLKFKPHVSDRDINAMFSESVANGAFIGQQVLALQDMKTKRCYVVSKLIG